MKAHFLAMASYATWANRQLHADAAGVLDASLHRDVGIYFRSLFGTLTHVLQSDRAWTFLLQGGSLANLASPAAPGTLAELLDARVRQDATFAGWLEGLDESWFQQPFRFESGLGQWKGRVYQGTHAGILTHVFNHQTHHRGQAHAALTILGVAEPRPLDIVVKGFLAA